MTTAPTTSSDPLDSRTPDAREADLTAAGVAWDLEPLVAVDGPDGPLEGEAGVDALLADAAARADALAGYRGRIATLSATDFAVVMREMAAIGEVTGRAGNYVGLRFAVDTADPPVGALMRRAEERAPTLTNEILFVELEWAALDDAHAEALLASDELAFCRHYLASARRYRPHLLSEPEERILSDKSLTANSAWVRLFSELTSAITVTIPIDGDGDGTDVSLEQGLSQLMSPDRDVRRTAAEAVTAGL